MKTAVLGLGIIGARAGAILHADSSLDARLWNRTKRGLPGEVDTLAEAVDHAQVVALYLKDAKAIRDVMTQVEDSANTTPTLVNHSTVDLDTTRWLAARCAALGWDFLDAPFTGSRDAAGAGDLVYYVGGDPATIEALTPFMLKTARQVIPCGEAGTATILKLVTNLISACSVQAMAEALATTRQHGIAAEALIEAVGSNACGSKLAGMKLPTMAQGDYETHFSLSNMLKDSRYALELAEDLDTPAIRAVSQRMSELCEQGLGDLDFSALAKPYQDS